MLENKVENTVEIIENILLRKKNKKKEKKTKTMKINPPKFFFSS